MVAKLIVDANGLARLVVVGQGSQHQSFIRVRGREFWISKSEENMRSLSPKGRNVRCQFESLAASNREFLSFSTS